ncbi:MAG: sulfur oxidation c-type cytochrome SoxA [Rhodospirillales bacterium]|nr:sulfur oxidation c-type cytochrome SoxA [Rhodospirillales bacterium]
MRRVIAAVAALAMLALTGAAPAPATAGKSNPAADLKAFQDYFKTSFPKVPFDDFVNGPYAVNKGMRAQWEQIMQFPPYDFELADGKKLFETKFANGKSYGDCFPDKGIGIAQTYPHFDAKTGQVVTLVDAINACRVTNGEAKLDVSKGPMAEIAAYMVSTSHGKRFDVTIPDDPRALAAYEAGKQFFYSRRGQLNFSCASCHVQSAGKRLRGDIIAPALGLVAAFPIYRDAWGNIGTLGRRFVECNAQVRAVAFKPDSTIYHDLEYFLTYMDNGLPVTGPGTRP